MLDVTDHRSATTTRCAPALVRVLDQVCEPRDRELAAETIPHSLDDPADTAPSVDEDLWLAHVCYARTHEVGLRRHLVEEYHGYAVSLAQRMNREGEPLEDLVQVAFEGLLVALNRFDPQRGVPFVGFATPTIVGGLKRHYRDAGWLVRVPRRVHELAGPARRASELLTAELGRSPSLDETAERMGVDVEDLILAEEALNARSTASIDALAAGENAERGNLVGAASDPGITRVDDLLTLKRALGELDERDRDVVRLYFFEDRSQSEIAELMGVSQMQISRWVANIVRRLASWMPTE